MPSGISLTGEHRIEMVKCNNVKLSLMTFQATLCFLKISCTRAYLNKFINLATCKTKLLLSFILPHLIQLWNSLPNDLHLVANTDLGKNLIELN